MIQFKFPEPYPTFDSNMKAYAPMDIVHALPAIGLILGVVLLMTVAAYQLWKLKAKGHNTNV